MTSFLAGQRLLATNSGDIVNKDVELDQSPIVAQSASFTTITDISGLSISFTLTEARTVAIKSSCLYKSSIAADIMQITIADSANVVQMTSGNLYVPVAVGSTRHEMTARLALAAGPYTYKIRAERISGTGSCFINASATSPSYIQALDIT